MLPQEQLRKLRSPRVAGAAAMSFWSSRPQPEAAAPPDERVIIGDDSVGRPFSPPPPSHHAHAVWLAAALVRLAGVSNGALTELSQ